MKFETMKANTSELQQGFDELMTYKLSVFRICLGYAKDPREAEDLAQDTYLKAYLKLETLKNPHCREVKKQWLFKIAKNTCLDHLKKQNRQLLSRSKPQNDPIERNTPETLAIQDQELNRLKIIIQQLPKKQQEVFILKEYAHLSYREIAASLDIKEGTVMSRLNRARQTVIEKMRGENHD
jgi:RNA polymerase sigma-70 factor (ECF subfamily)